MSSTTFIYALTCPDTNEVKYVGKADNPEARFKHHLASKQQNRKTKWIKSLLDIGKQPVLIILEEVPISEWIEAEKEWIEYYRLNSTMLTNIMDGGGYNKPPAPKMLSTTVCISDELDDWLMAEASLNHRSKNKQIIYLLEQFRQMDDKGQ